MQEGKKYLQVALTQSRKWFDQTISKAMSRVSNKLTSSSSQSCPYPKRQQQILFVCKFICCNLENRLSIFPSLLFMNWFFNCPNKFKKKDNKLTYLVQNISFSPEEKEDPFKFINAEFQRVYRHTKNITLNERVNKCVIGTCFSYGWFVMQLISE